MRGKVTSFSFVFILALFLSSISMAQTVNVKMVLNTATCLDTLKPEHVVQLRGESAKGTTPAITWDDKTGITATNIGGDYWEANFQATAGDTIKYKIWTGFTTTTGTFHWTGWEGPINSGMSAGDNRVLIVGNADTTLATQYFNGLESSVGQYAVPFETKQDTIAIYFRVNMGGANFDPATQIVDVRGGAPLGTDSPWITIKTLSQESNSVNAGSFWSGVAYIAKSAITPGTTAQKFKFVIQPEIWESVGDRTFTFSSLNDTTIHWYYFNNIAPSGPRVEADLLFRLKLDALEDAGLFDRSLGDKVAVTGAKGWPPTTFVFDTEPAMLKMTYNSSDEEWNLVEHFNLFPNEVFEYKYYINWDTSRVDTNSPNYIVGLDLTNGWEEPGVTGGGNRTYTYTSEAQQFLPGDFGNEQQFFNSLDPKGVIKTPLTVSFKVNMAPATDLVANPTNPLFRPGIDTVYIQFDGSFVPVTQGLAMYGATNRVMLNDTDGDGIYTGSWVLTPPTFNQFCFHVVYTSTSGDIENGGGVQSGRRYYQYVHPSSVTGEVISWPESYDFNELAWMNDSLTVEDPPSFTVGVDGSEVLPQQYSLSQNYPNPFNPVTNIKYHIPVRSAVKLQVYDITGRLVKVLADKEQEAGTHMVSWNGIDNSGQAVASGVYFMRIIAGTYNNTIKMMMLK